jgi:hypothetical protein
MTEQPVGFVGYSASDFAESVFIRLSLGKARIQGVCLTTSHKQGQFLLTVEAAAFCKLQLSEVRNDHVGAMTIAKPRGAVGHGCLSPCAHAYPPPRLLIRGGALGALW